MKIAHISDIHHCSAYRSLQYSKLFTVLKSENVDAVVVSGDLCDKGGCAYSSIAEALSSFRSEFLDRLTSETGLKNGQVIICPGNHDIDRTAIGEFTWQSMQAKAISNWSQALKNYKEFESRWKEFNLFLRGWYGDSENFKSGDLVHSLTTEVDGRKYAFLIVNNVWLTSNCTEQTGDIIFPIFEMESFCQKFDPNTNKILVAHARYQDANSLQKNDVENFIYRNFSQVYCGHYHEPRPEAIQRPNGTVFSSRTRKFMKAFEDYSDIAHANGFTILDLTDENVVAAKGYRENGSGEFIFDHDIYPEGASNYQLKKTVIKPFMAKAFEYKINSVQNKFQDFDKSLLSSTLSQTIAPKELSKIFVMPPIIQREVLEKTGSVKESMREISFFLKNGGRHCLFGKQESGKTTLAQKIHVEALTTFSKVSLILDFEEIIDKRRLRQAIATKVGIKERDVDDLVSDKSFVLIVDDFDFSRAHRISDKDIIEKCENQILLHSTESTQIIPKSALESDIFANYIPAFIEDFRSKQIKELTANWFSVDKKVAREKMDFIVMSFKNMGLPCTPLSISIFLWIIESQQGKAPINKFTLIDQFVERLFGKADAAEVQSSTFDYRNKTRVLAMIAKKMLDQNAEGYSLPKLDVIEVVRSYVTINSMKFDPVKIYNEFVDVGVLAESIEELDCCPSAKFRYACLFAYYLMQEMVFNESFCKEATSKEKYIHYIEEIEMLTGKTRNLQDLLKNLTNWMCEFYDPVCENFESHPGSYDAAFATSNSSFTKATLSIVRRNGKLTEEQLDEITDRAIASIPSDQIIPQKGKIITDLDKSIRLWEVVARALKNTEEVSDPDLKAFALQKVIKSSLASSLIYKRMLDAYVAKSEQNSRTLDYKMISGFMPLIHQNVIKELLGTEKLNLLIKQKIQRDLLPINPDGSRVISEYEWFVTLFLYADLNGDGFKNEIQEFVMSAKNRLILDMTAFKVLSYFLFNSKTAESDQFYLNQLGDIASRSNGNGRGKKLDRKSKVIDSYREMRVKRYGKHTKSIRRKKR